jgi:hypothetical protein
MDQVVVYWNIHNEKPVYNFANENITDMEDFASKVVPEGVHYNIVEKSDIYNLGVPPLTNITLTDDFSRKKYYEYMGAL